MSQKSNSKYLLALVPKNAPNLDEITNGDAKLSDCIRLVYHYLFMLKLAIWKKDLEDRPNFYNQGWIPLNVLTIRNIIYQDKAIKILKYMVDKGLLEKYSPPAGQKFYIVGKLSGMYRIPGNMYQKKERGFLYRKEQVTTKTLVNKVLKFKEQMKTEKIVAEFKLYQPEYASLIKMVEQFKPIITDVKQLLLSKEVSDQDNYGELQMFLDTFETDQNRCMTCDFGNRFHSPFTNLKSEYRSLFRFDEYMNDKHISIDVTCSQWYFLGILLSKPDQFIKRYLPEFKIAIPLFAHCSGADDVQKFLQFTSTGGFYEHWAEKRWPVESLSCPLTTRDKAKSELSYILFGKVHTHHSTPNYATLVDAKELFQKLFPTVWNVIVGIKELGKDELPFMDLFYYDKKTGKYMGNKLSHKNMSALLQRLESRILIGTISSRLIKKKVVFVTIHDSFLAPSKFEKIIKNEIELFFKWYKLPHPKLKTEDL